MNSQRSPIKVVWKSSIIILLVLLAFQSFGINGLAAPATPSFYFQEGDNHQLACSTSPTPLQFCDIQIVLLIDDSGSMKFNDPQGIRNQGAKNLVDFLATQYYLPAKEYLESVKSTNDPPVIEIAVAHFTTKVEILTDWEKVDPTDPEYWKKVDPTNLEDWKNDKVVFDEAIDWNDPVEKNTDFKDPFDKAAGLLTSLNAQAKDEGCTKRLILLFTDGTPQNGGTIDVNQKMFEVESTVDGIPLDLNVEIYVTGFKVKDNYWDKVENHWSRIVGSSDEQDPPRSVLLKDKDGENPLNLLGIRMEKIVAHSIGVQSADLKPDPTDPQAYTVEIPEYVQSLRLTLYNLNPETGLVITGPDGTGIVADSENVTLSGQDTSSEVWQLETPVAGKYKVKPSQPGKPSQSGGIVTAFLTFQNLAVKVDGEASWLQVSEPGVIKFKLTDSSGKEIVLPNDNPPYTLEEMQVSVTQGTQIEKQPLEWEQEGDSYQVSWTPQSSETVQLDIAAKLVSANGNTLVNCAGVVDVPVNQNPPPPTLHVTPPTSCVSPDETIILPTRLEYEGDRAWANTLDWNVSADGQDINATATAIDVSKGEYELRIDPIEDTEVEDIQLMVSAEAVIDGQAVKISDETTTTIEICPAPLPCDCIGGFPIWLIFIWLLMWLVLLLLGWVILRDRKIHIKFWLLVILEIVLAVVWFILFSGYLVYLFWMLLLIILLIILVFVFRKVIKDISWWLIILLTLFVSIWFVLFGGFPIWLILLLMLMWLGFLILMWVFNMTEPPSWRWLVLVLLLILALVSIIYFNAYWIYLLLWLLTILVLTLIILVIGPICPPISIPPDDLKELEGIEGDVEQLLNDHGVYTFRQLAETDINQLNDWLNENNWKYMDPKTWPQQAKLADIAKRYRNRNEADEKSYLAYKKWLKNGIEPDEYEDKEKVRRSEALVWRGTAELTEKDNPEIFHIDY